MFSKVPRIAAVALLGAVLVPGMNAQPASLLQEHFEGPFPPPGWSIIVETGQNQWHRNDFWGRPNYTGGGGYCADNDDAATSPGAARVANNALQSPTFDASGYQTVWLAYNVDWYPVLYAVGRVDVYNGSNWVPVLGHGSTRKTTRDSINISVHVAGKANGRVRFLYHELTGGVKSNWYEVDAVKVWGSDPPEPLDLVMAEIIRPNDHEEPGFAFAPKCKVYNNLDTAAHAMLSCQIKEVPTYKVVYEDAHQNYPCNPGYTDVVFKPFIPLANKTYNASFVVNHPNDVNKSNNEKNKYFNTSQVDVTPYEMVLPMTPQQFDAFEPSANYAERIGQLTPYVSMFSKIERLDDLEEVYRDTLPTHTFESFDSVMAVFDTASLSSGSYIITFWACDDKHDNISHPPLVDTFDYVAGIGEEASALGFSLDAMMPNPASACATVRFTLGRRTHVNLCIYDALGRTVTRLIEETRGAGSYAVEWNAEDTPRGVYFVRLSTPEFRAYRKLLVTK